MDINQLIMELLKIVILIVISGLGIVVRKYGIPALKKFQDSKDITITETQYAVIKSIVHDLVESAYRLGMAEKITDLKKYVLDKAKAELGALGLEISDELLDEIRRACVVDLEKTLAELENTVITEDEAAE